MARQPGTYAIFDTTEGAIVVRLFETDAPVTVKNFIELAEGSREWSHPTTREKSNNPLYNGTDLSPRHSRLHDPGWRSDRHRHGRPGLQVPGRDQGIAAQLRQDQGKLAMANSGPNTNGSQFFITVAPTAWLTGNHTIFGEVVEGQDIADKISKLPRNRQDKPDTDVVLNSVKIERV